MTVHHLGTLNLGEAAPTALAAQGALDATIGVALPDIQAKLAGLLSVNVLPPTLAASLNTALQLVANIQAAIVVGVPPVDFQLAALADLIGSLQGQLAALQSQVAFSAALGVTLGAAGIHMYGYTGEAGSLGNEFQGQLSGGFPGGQPTDDTYAVMLAATTPAARAALQGFFKSF